MESGICHICLPQFYEELTGSSFLGAEEIMEEGEETVVSISCSRYPVPATLEPLLVLSQSAKVRQHSYILTERVIML